MPTDTTAHRPEPGHDQPPDPAAVYRQVARLVVWLCPQATNCRIEFDMPNGTGGTIVNRLSVPTHPDPEDDLEVRVLAELGALRAGLWMAGKVLAVAVDTTPDNGHFRRTMARLARADGPIESHCRHGYRLRHSGRPLSS